MHIQNPFVKFGAQTRKIETLHTQVLFTAVIEKFLFGDILIPDLILTSDKLYFYLLKPVFSTLNSFLNELSNKM